MFNNLKKIIFYLVILVLSISLITGCSNSIPNKEQSKKITEEKTEETKKVLTPEEVKKEQDEKEIRTVLMDLFDLTFNLDYKTYNPESEFQFYHPYLIDAERKTVESTKTSLNEKQLNSELVDAKVESIILNAIIDNQEKFFGKDSKEIAIASGRLSYKITSKGSQSTSKANVGDIFGYDFYFTLVKENGVWKVFKYKLTPITK